MKILARTVPENYYLDPAGVVSDLSANWIPFKRFHSLRQLAYGNRWGIIYNIAVTLLLQRNLRETKLETLSLDSAPECVRCCFRLVAEHGLGVGLLKILKDLNVFFLFTLHAWWIIDSELSEKILLNYIYLNLNHRRD